MERNDTRKQLKLGALISYAAIIINTIIALLYTPWMARELGTSDYALYNLAYSFVRMFMNDFGLSSAVSRFAAKYRAENKEEQVGKLVGTITRLYLLIDAFIFAALLVIYFFIGQIYKGLTPAEIVTFRKLYIIMSFSTVISFPFLSQSGILTAYEKFIQLKLCDLAQKLLSVGMIVFALLNHMDVVAVMAAYAGAGLIVIGIKAYVIHKYTDVRPDLKENDLDIRKAVLGFSIWMAISSIAATATFGLAPSIMGIVSNSKEIALFSPANALEGYFYMIAAAVNGLFLARVSRMIEAGDEKGIYRLMVNVGRYQLALMGLVYVGFICIGKDFMVAWMGTEYERTYYCAILLFFPDLLQFAEQIANTTVIAKNKVKYSAFAAIGKTITCIAVSFPLSHLFGAVGASAAIALSYLVDFIIMNVVYHRQLGLDIPRFFKECYGSFLLPYFISTAISMWLISFVPVGGWTGVLLKGIITVIIYAFVVWTAALRKDEKQFLLKRLRRRR